MYKARDSYYYYHYCYFCYRTAGPGRSEVRAALDLAWPTIRILMILNSINIKLIIIHSLITNTISIITIVLIILCCYLIL